MKEPDPIASLEARSNTSAFYDSVPQIVLENVLKALKVQDERIKHLEENLLIKQYD